MYWKDQSRALLRGYSGVDPTHFCCFTYDRITVVRILSWVPCKLRLLISLFRSTFFGTSSRMPTHHQNVHISPQMDISRVTKKLLSRNAEFEVGNTDNLSFGSLQQVCSAISVRVYSIILIKISFMFKSALLFSFSSILCPTHSHSCLV